jgi:hypothetical protein
VNGETTPLNPLRFTFHSFFRLIRELIQNLLKLPACRFHCRFIGISQNPDGGTPQIEPSGPWVRDHEPVPARKEFFFEQLNASGTIGSPVAFAN